MKVKSMIAPVAPFTVDVIPYLPGYVLVRFFENIETTTDVGLDGAVYNGFTYDEYQLEIEDTGSVYADVLANFDNMLMQAKERENNDPDKLPDRVSTLENEKAGKDEVEAIWNQMAEAYSEGVQEA